MIQIELIFTAVHDLLIFILFYFHVIHIALQSIYCITEDVHNGPK